MAHELAKVDEVDIERLIAKAREAVKQLGLTEVHHVALIQPKPHPQAVLVEPSRCWVSPIVNGVEVLSYEEDSPVHPLLKEKPHVCFLVDSVDKYVTGEYPVLLEPFGGALGRAAFVYINGAVIELLESPRSS